MTPADFANDPSDKKKETLSIFEGDAAVLNCPVSGIPERNFSWHFNSIEIAFDGGLKHKDIR